MSKEPQKQVENNVSAIANEQRITWLPAVLPSSDYFRVNVNTRMIEADLDVYLPDGSKNRVNGVSIEGYNSTVNSPIDGAIFRLTWQGEDTNYTSLSKLIQVPGNLKATFVSEKGAYSESIEAKKWTRTADGFMDSKSSMGSFLSTTTTINNFEVCSINSPKNLQQALEMKAKTDSQTGILGLKNGGNVNVGSAIVVSENGIFFYNGNNKKTPIAVGVDGKVTVQELETAKDSIASRQTLSGMKAKPIYFDDMLPTGTIFTPRLTKLPTLDALEWVIKMVDSSKLICDFITAFDKLG